MRNLVGLGFMPEQGETGQREYIIKNENTLQL